MDEIELVEFLKGYFTEQEWNTLVCLFHLEKLTKKQKENYETLLFRLIDLRAQKIQEKQICFEVECILGEKLFLGKTMGYYLYGYYDDQTKDLSLLNDIYFNEDHLTLMEVAEKHKVPYRKLKNYLVERGMIGKFEEENQYYEYKV